jgi:hypothetical protein
MKPGRILIFTALIVLIIIISCNKSGSKGKPTLSLESINTTIQVDDSLRALFKFSNGGALQNGIFYSIRMRLNQSPPSDSAGPDTLPTPVPAFSSASNGEIRYALPWDGYLSETGFENDTLVFKFFVITADSVSSDTILSPKIVVLYQ